MRLGRRSGPGFAAAAAAILSVGGGAAQEGGDGVFPDSIVFGQSAALEGPAGELGRNMSLGIRAAFEEANRDGGVHGRLLRLIVRDDGYEPEAAVANTDELIAHGVFGLIGAVGTPTSNAAEPGASEAGVPYIGAFTGAGSLRQPDQRYVVNLRASYDQETRTMVDRLVEDLGFGASRCSTRTTPTAKPASRACARRWRGDACSPSPRPRTRGTRGR